MAKSRYNDDYDYDYEEEPSSGGSKAMIGFLAILGVLLLALTVLCVVLTGRLRRADGSIADLQQQLDAARTVTWNTPEPTPADNGTGTDTGTDTVTVPIPSAQPQEATPTPEPTLTPEPTATPAPSPALSGGLPSWITERDMAGVTRRPKDDEWYGQPGKLYVTATLGLNMRSGTRTDINNLITQVKYGSEVMVYAASGNMRFVQDPKGNFGWVSNTYLSNELPAGVEVIPFAPTSAAPAASPTPVSSPEPTVTPENNRIPDAEAPRITG